MNKLAEAIQNEYARQWRGKDVMSDEHASQIAAAVIDSRASTH